MGLESEVETFHLRKEAEGAGRSLPCFFLILLLSYHSDLSRRQLLSVWRHSECPAAASAKACSPRTGLGYFRVARRPRTRQEIKGADMPQQGPFKSSYPPGAATRMGRCQSTAARQSASRETGHHARRQRWRGLALDGDLWRQAIRGTRTALETVSCARSGNDRRWEQRHCATKVHVKLKERPLKEINLMKKRVEGIFLFLFHL